MRYLSKSVSYATCTCVQLDFINPYRIQSKAGLFQMNDSKRRLGYLFTGDSLDRQVDHRIYRLIWVAVNFWGGDCP